MSLYQDDPNDKNYVLFNEKGSLISIRNASKEIKQISENHISSGGICYILSKIISLAPIIDNYISIKELSPNNNIRRFEVNNKAKGNSRIVELRVGKMPGFPKSKKSIDIQVLLEYLKEEIREVNKDLIEIIKNAKNSEFTFEDKDMNYKFDKILLEIAECFNYYDKKYGYGNYIEKNKDGIYVLKDKEGLIKKIMSDKENFNYIIDNIPGFIMSSGGCSKNVSTILTGRPSKYFRFEDYKDNDKEFEKIFEKLSNNCINDLNSLTISIKGHALAIIKVIKVKGEKFYLIQNPWGCGDKDDIDSTESDKILKGTEYQNYNSLNYETKGLALLNIKDIKKTFKSISALDFEVGKYIYTENISDEKLIQNKKFDFILDMKKEDNIKFDVTNFNTDLQYDNSDSYCINNFTIFDENYNKIKTIFNNDLSDIKDKNVIEELETGKRYLIRVDINKPCNINIIRNYDTNEITFLGERKDENINLCRGENIIKNEEGEKKNKYRFEGDLKDTLRIVRLMENEYNEPSYSQIEKISKDEIIVNGKSILKNELLYKVVNDIKNKIIKGIDTNSNKEIIKLENNNIISLGQNMTHKLENKELILNEEKIGIIDEDNKEHYIDIEELDNYRVKKYIISSLVLGKEELTIKNNIFNNKDEAIKKIQEIAKNNAGLIKDFMTGGVEFENPKIFKNFLENFYTYKEHIIAFKCEKNAINDIKNVLRRILNNNVVVNSIQEIWETILDELIDGFLIGGCLPFISLHFNEKALLYSVMNPNYKHTIVGHVLTFIDYFLKGFTNGAYFDEKFVYEWYENKSNCFNNTTYECRNSLFKNCNNLFKYIKENNININYITTSGIYDDMLINGDEQYYLSTNRIIGQMCDLFFDENILYPKCNFTVEGDLDPLPSLLRVLKEKSVNNFKWEKTKRAHEEMKYKIKWQINKLPFLKGYFYLLDMITFAIYYLASIKSLSSLPDISNSLKKKYSKKGEFYIRVIPSVYPPLPTTKYIIKDYSILFNDLVSKLNINISNEINYEIFRIINNRLEENIKEELKKKMLKEIERIFIDDCYNKFIYEISIENKESLRYSIQYFDSICEDLYIYWIWRINDYRKLIKDLKDKIIDLSNKNNYSSIQQELRNVTFGISVLDNSNKIKNLLNDEYQREKNSYIKMVSEIKNNKGLFNLSIFTFKEMMSNAIYIKDFKLVDQIKKILLFDDIKYKLDILIKSLVNKNFYEYFTFIEPYKRKLIFRLVGYHEGISSYRGGCLVDYNQNIELKEIEDINKKILIKNSFFKEEIKIGEECYFLVKTKLKSLFLDKYNLLEANKLDNPANILNFNYKNEKGLSSTFLKLLSNNEKVFNDISSNDLTKSDESNENALTYISSISNSKLVENLIIRQNSIYNLQKGNNMITPLLSAISIKNLELTEILIKKGFNINDTTDIKFTPLHFASYYNLPKIVQLLFQKKAETNIKTKKEGEIPLHLACRKGNFEIVKLLVNNKNSSYINNINIQKSDNKTSLHLAATTSSLCTQILLKNNANTDLKDNNEDLPSKLAIIYGREDIYNMIGNSDISTLILYNEIKKYDIYDNNQKLDEIKKLCKFMRTNNLKEALKITDLITENKYLVDRINNNKTIKEKIIRNACKGTSIQYLNILFKLMDLNINKNIIFYYIYKYRLNSWKIELNKKNILFNLVISEDNWYIIEYLLKNNEDEFIKLMNLLEEIPSEYLSKILSIKCLNRIEIKNFEEIFMKFKPHNINIQEFSESSLTTLDDINYLIKHRKDFDINFNTLDLKKMVKFCNPSVLRFFTINRNYISNACFRISKGDLINEAKKEKRTDNLIIIFPLAKLSDLEENKYNNSMNKNKENDVKISDLKYNETYDFKIFNKYHFGLYEFKENKNIFDLIFENKRFKDLKKIENFPMHLINKEVLFNYLKNLEYNIPDLPLKDIFESYLFFLINNINNNKEYKNNLNYYSYFIDLIDIAILKQKKKWQDFDSLYEKTIDSLVEVLQKNKNMDFLSLIRIDKNQNIMHILTKNDVFISEKSKKKILDLLEIIEINSKDSNSFKSLFNDVNSDYLYTFLMYLNYFQKHELFVEIYLKYRELINPFVFNIYHENLLHLIIKNLKEDSTIKVCLDKYIYIIKDIIFKNPNIIFVKNVYNISPVSLIFINDNNITGIFNIMNKVFTFDSLNTYSEEDLLEITLRKDNIFILRHLIENYHLNIINKILKFGISYPLHLSALCSKVDLFELLIEYGANPFLKNKINFDAISYAMQYGNFSFLEHICNMKMNEICFNNEYLFDLASNKEGFEIFKKIIRNKNINLNILDLYGKSLLIHACQNNNYEIINILIDHGIDPLLKDNYSNTALHYCCINNSINSINLLLQKLYYKSKSLVKKCLLFPNNNDDTPLHLAAKNGHLEITEKLLVYILSIENNKQKIRIKSKGEFLPIHYSIINEKIPVSLFLLKALNITDNEIEDISRDSFFDKIKDFISNKKLYNAKNKNMVNKYIDKLNNDINELESDFSYNKKIYQNCELNSFDDIYNFNLTKKLSFEKLITKINTYSKFLSSDNYKYKLLKYFNYINKEKMIGKIISIVNNHEEKYILNLLDNLNKSDWMKYEKLERIVHLFMSNIIPFIENKYLYDCLNVLDNLINKDILKEKIANNFLSWIEVIIISISEDKSEFNLYEIIYIIKDFYEIILVKLNNCGLEILDYPHSNFKFYYYIKQLISLLKIKSREYCILQIKNIDYMPAIILEENEIMNDQYSIFHYSRLYKYDELYDIINNILKNRSLPSNIIGVCLSIFNNLLNNINYYEISGPLYTCQKNVLTKISDLINDFSFNNEQKLEILQNIKNNLIEFCNEVIKNNINAKSFCKSTKFLINEDDILINNILNKIKNDIKFEESLSINEDLIINNSNEINQLKEILLKLKVQKWNREYDFIYEGRTLSKKFFKESNVGNLIELIKIIIEGFLSVNIIVDINQILVFSYFMLFYINKMNLKLKGRIGEYYYENKTIIIAMIALAHALNDKNVDIISPSEYLSQKYIKKFEDIYNLFGIESNTIDKSLDHSTQIIYGTLQNFLFQIIKEIFI